MTDLDEELQEAEEELEETRIDMRLDASLGDCLMVHLAWTASIYKEKAQQTQDNTYKDKGLVLIQEMEQLNPNDILVDNIKRDYRNTLV